MLDDFTGCTSLTYTGVSGERDYSACFTGAETWNNEITSVVGTVVTLGGPGANLINPLVEVDLMMHRPCIDID